MVFYYGRRFDSASVGVRVIQVFCDKCGCEYFNELAASAPARGAPPTRSASRLAAAASTEKAKLDLNSDSRTKPS